MAEKLFNSFIIHLREQLTCPMCQSLFHNPRTLPCLHSVCQECLMLLEKRSRQPTEAPALKCPACNLDIDTSEGFNVEEMPCSSYVRRLKEFVNVANNNFDVPCGRCKQHPTAVACCFDCKCLICRACLGAHKRMSSMKNHCISDLSTIDVSRLPELLQGTAFCRQPEHKGEALAFFCEECLTCVCEKCLHDTHSAHKEHIQKVVALQESSDASKLRMHRALGILQEKKQACHDGIKKVDQSYRTVERRVIDARQNVHTKIEEMIRLLKNHENEILSELEGVYKSQQAAILKHRRGLQQTIEQIRRAHEDVKRALERNLPEEISELEDPVAKHFLRLLDAAEPTSSPAKSINVDYFPDEEVSRILTSPSTPLGHMSVSYTDPTCTVVEGDTLNETTIWTGERIQFAVITRDSEEKMTYSENDCLAVNIHVDNGKEGKVIPARIADCTNGKYLISYTPFQAGVYKIDVRVRGNLIKGSPFKMKAVARKTFSKASCSPALGLTGVSGETHYRAVMPFGDPQNKLVHGLKAPRGIAVSSRGEIAVADTGNGRVQIFTADGDFLTQFGERKEPGLANLTSPVGVAFDIEGNIVVSDCDSRKIHVLSREGHIVRTFGSDTLEYPLGLCTTLEGKITVCDWGSGSIKEFSSEGKLLQEFSYIPAKHYQSGTPARPYYICQQRDDYLVSLDIGCVCVFDKEGHFLRSVSGKTGHGRESLQLKEPRGLTVDSNDNLIVCDSGQHRLHMFTVDGRTVLLGTRGRDLGQFDRIQDVVAAHSGKLYVTDHGNNRVQVFQ